MKGQTTSKVAMPSGMLMSLEMRLAEIIVASTNWNNCCHRQQQKYLRFLSPTQLPIQGQWWSQVDTHLLQFLQCLDLRGCSMVHTVQYLSSTQIRPLSIYPCCFQIPSIVFNRRSLFAALICSLICLVLRTLTTEKSSSKKSSSS